MLLVNAVEAVLCGVRHRYLRGMAVLILGCACGALYLSRTSKTYTRIDGPNLTALEAVVLVPIIIVSGYPLLVVLREMLFPTTYPPVRKHCFMPGQYLTHPVNSEPFAEDSMSAAKVGAGWERTCCTVAIR